MLKMLFKIINVKNSKTQITLALLSILCISISVWIGSMTKNEVSIKIMEKLDKQNECEIFLKEYTHFDWDEIVIFYLNAAWEDDDVSAAIGEPYKRTYTDESGFIFFRDGKIVHKEIYKENNGFDNYQEKFIIMFDDSYDFNLFRFPSEDAKFYGVKKDLGDRFFRYNLDITEAVEEKYGKPK